MENNRNSIHIHSVKYNFIMNIILKISQYVFPLITLPYITRILGTIGNGKVSFQCLHSLVCQYMESEFVQAVEMTKIN